jgi:hypothetical protein
VNSGVLGEIQKSECGAREDAGRFDAGQCEHASVVIGVAVEVEEVRTDTLR